MPSAPRLELLAARKRLGRERCRHHRTLQRMEETRTATGAGLWRLPGSIIAQPWHAKVQASPPFACILRPQTVIDNAASAAALDASRGGRSRIGTQGTVRGFPADVPLGAVRRTHALNVDSRSVRHDR